MTRIPAIFVIGSAGSGKSTVARALAAALRAAYLDKDDVANRFTGALLEAGGEDAGARDGSTLYVESVRPLEYATLLDLASANLRVGLPVVLDAPFGAYFAEQDFISRISQEHDWPSMVHPTVVHVSASAAATRRRLIGRGLERDRWKLDHWESFWSSIGSSRPTWRDVPVVDVTNDADGRCAELAQDILEHMGLTSSPV